jgi:IS30 family transposase
MSHLRTNRLMRRSKNATTAGQTRGQIVGAVPIGDRPANVERRVVAGHWEGDLIAGAKNSHVATLVERKTRFTILVKVKGKDAKSVGTAVTRRLKKLPAPLRRTLTWDRGTEMANHARLTRATSMDVFFCDPSSPWQRGTNENTNRLLRQYLPKETELFCHSQDQLNRIAARLNERPRKTLGFNSPMEALERVLR